MQIGAIIIMQLSFVLSIILIRPFVSDRKNQVKFFSELGLTCVFVILAVLTLEPDEEEGTFFMALKLLVLAVVVLVAGSLLLYSLFFALKGIAVIIKVFKKMILKCKGEKIQPNKDNTFDEDNSPEAPRILYNSNYHDKSENPEFSGWMQPPNRTNEWQPVDPNSPKDADKGHVLLCEFN